MDSTDHELADALTAVILSGLEELEPTTRVAYVLHDAFAMDIEAIAAIVERTPTVVGQLVLAARAHIQQGSPGL